jgi:3-deoxy-7-phosphoheptulonate synthase
VAADIATQISRGNKAIVGIMLESFIEMGRQNVEPGTALRYGQSITDPCMAWDQTEQVLENLANAVSTRRLLI